MGTTKGLLDLNGKPFISHCIAALQPLVKDLYIVSDDPVYDRFHCTRVKDIFKDAGPVGGLYAGLSASNSAYNIVLSCDVPFINSAILTNLVRAIHENFDVIQVQCEGRTHPLIAIYQKNCAPHFQKALLSGERRLRIALEGLRLKTIVLDPDWAPLVRNINTQNDYDTIKNEIEH